MIQLNPTKIVNISDLILKQPLYEIKNVTPLL